MIFSLFSLTPLFFSVLFPSPTITVANVNDWRSDVTSQEEKAEPHHVGVDYSNYDKNKKIEEPEVSNWILDLDHNGKNESIVVKSYLSIHGDQNTEIYINSNSQPVLTEIGSFHSIEIHKMDNSGHYIVELQLQTSQSINALFYLYQKGKLERVSVSTEKSPSWHGIISRNSPELKDIDNDGTLELLAYYNFLSDPIRKVEVYKYNGKSFNKTQEYEEVIPDKYL
ncbi:MAG: hypothetical protein ACOZAN_00855 [Patescibacteria group bacterium]